MKHIINEMIDEFNQEIQREYQQLHSNVLEGQYTAANKTAEAIKTLQSAINVLNILLSRIGAKEAQC